MITLSLSSDTDVQRADVIPDVMPSSLNVRRPVSESVLSEAMLNKIPRLNARPEDKPQELSVFETAPNGVAAEQFRLMQRRLVNLRPTGGSVLLTSPGAGDGKSLNAHNLANALAEAGHNTLLLELDLRRPSQHRYFATQPAKNLVNVLVDDVPPVAAVRRISDAPLYYLGLDKPAARPVKLLRSDALVNLLRWAREHFDWVIVDGPPVLAVSDVEELLPKVDLVLLVARARTTPRAILERAAEHLGDRLDFVIFNDVTLSNEYGYGYK